MNFLTQYFLNHSFVLPGAALASIPVIIHFISRLRYRRVKFAAMEFLLESEQRNRRRLIIEQLLLLLLRILAVILIVLLIARLVFDQAGLKLFQGASVHVVVILDDTLSMQDAAAEGTVFDEARSALEQLVAGSGEQAGTRRLTLLKMTEPERPVVTDQVIEGTMVQDLLPRIRNLKCSYRDASPAAAIQAAHSLLKADPGVAPQVVVLTDLREHDWDNRPDIVSAVKALDSINAKTVFVKLAEEAHENLSLTSIDADVTSISSGVPWRIAATIRNYGRSVASGQNATVLQDGQPLPGRLLIPDIESGAEVTVYRDLLFQEPGRYEIRVALEDDALPADNWQVIAVEVAPTRSVLIVDDDPAGQDSLYVQMAMSADPSLTGISSDIRTSEALTEESLKDYDCALMLNVGSLTADVVEVLAEFVRNGGGLAWFPGEQADLDFYNLSLQRPAARLFPVPLAGVAGDPDSTEDDAQAPTFESHPIFALYTIPNSPLASLIRVKRWFRTRNDWERDDVTRNDGVTTVARLADGQPLILEHTLGRGKIITALTSAGRRWSNWPLPPSSPGYVVTMLRLHQHLQRPADFAEDIDLRQQRVIRFPVADYADTVELVMPTLTVASDGGNADEAVVEMVSLRGSAESADDTGDAVDSESPNDRNKQSVWAVSLPKLEIPGILKLRRFPNTGDVEELWMVANVESDDSDLKLADDSRLRSQLDSDAVTIAAGRSLGAIVGDTPGREIRWILIGLLLAVLVAEQLLSLRMSYHPDDQKAAA